LLDEGLDPVLATENRVVLTVSEGEMEEMGWPGLEADQSVLKPLGEA
jgi:hypothetical protein